MLRLIPTRASLLTLFSCWMFAVLCFAEAKPQASPGAPVAIVAGQPIYEQDLAAELGPKLLQLRNQEYQIKSKALDELIRKRLIDAEAQKRGISADKLLEQDVDSKVADPSDAEVEGYYLAVQGQVNQPFQEIKPQIQK